MENPSKDNAKPEHKIKVVKICSGYKRWVWQTIPPPCPPGKNLTTLPNEILSLIATYATKNDLLSFRATSKQLHGNSTATYIVHFIHDIKITLGRQSLQALVDISQHEVFGSHVRAVSIDPVLMRIDRCICDLEDCHGCHGVDSGYESSDTDNDNDDSSTNPDSENGKPVQNKKGERTNECLCPLARVWTCCQEQQEIMSIGDDLHKTFTSLARWGQSLCLSVGAYYGKPIGEGEFCGHEHLFGTKMELGIIFKELLKTAANCKLNVQKLSIEVAEDNENLERSGTLLLTASEVGYASVVLSRLRRIDLKLLAAPLALGFLAESCDSMARLLSVSNNLEVLTLDVDLEECSNCKCVDADEMQATDPLGKLARSLASSKLLELELHCIYGHEADFKKLISKHALSLESLTLNCCCIWEGGGGDEHEKIRYPLMYLTLSKQCKSHVIPRSFL